MESQPGDGAEKMEARGKKAGSLERGTEEADKCGRGWLVGRALERTRPLRKQKEPETWD